MAKGELMHRLMYLLADLLLWWQKRQDWGEDE
jgi:hypothetical protein